jgi:class 3 adenylate cyclase
VCVSLALAQVGDLLDDPELTGAAWGQLHGAYERGCVIPPDWPVLVPRVLAGAARQLGHLETAARCLAHAEAIVHRERLAVEAALVALERLRLNQALGHEPEPAALDATRRRFEELAMPGWSARAHHWARCHGLAEQLPPGALARARTILTTDVVGSTAATIRLGDALYVEQLRIHDRLSRDRVRQFHGTEIKHTGDGLNVVFDNAAAACACALAIQADLQAWAATEPDLALSVRCGLALGDLVPYDGDLFGVAQSEAARLCALARPGEVVMSGAVRAVLPPDVRVDDLGEHSLRGLPAGTRVYRAATVSDLLPG